MVVVVSDPPLRGRSAMVSYLSDLRRLDTTAWPHISSDYDTMLREYDVRMVLLTSHQMVRLTSHG
jgi:hypothetical protein